MQRIIREKTDNELRQVIKDILADMEKDIMQTGERSGNEIDYIMTEVYEKLGIEVE